MPEQQEFIISLLGGVQQDASPLNPRIIDQGQNPYEFDYKYALNVRIGSSIEDNVGAAENILSSLPISNYYTWNGSAFIVSSPPSGTDTAINKYQDIPNKRVYFFVHNTDGNHKILCYLKATRQIFEILLWSGLDFSLTSFVSACKVDKYLIFTDRNKPPRIANVDINSTSSVTELKRVLGINFSEFHISLAKFPPLAPIEVFRDVVLSPSDYIEKGIFQFTYRHIYKGGFKSTFAPFTPFVTNQETTVPTQSFTFYIPGFFYDQTAGTYFDYSSVKFYEAVEFIEFVYRESSRDSWKLFKRHKVTSTPPSIQFSNNGPTARIPDQDMGQYFDTIPFLSGACESIDNRIKLADNQDELPAVTDFDVENIQVHSEGTADSITSWNGPTNNFSSLSFGDQLFLGGKLLINKKSFKERCVYKLGIVFQHHSGRANLVTTLDKWTYIIPSSASTVPAVIERYHALGFTIPGSVLPPEWAVGYQIMRSNALKIDAFYYGIANDFKFLANDDNGITYYVATPEDIRNASKEYAFRTRELKDEFGTLSFSDLILAVIRKNKEVAISAASRIYIDISNWYLTPSRNTPETQDWPANSMYYNYQKGDRVRFKGSKTSGYDSADLFTFDEEIVEFTGNGVIVNKPTDLVTLKDRNDAAPNTSQSYIIEIYRPSQYNLEQDIIFNEIGEWYPITNPGTPSRDFAKRDFTWSNAASVTVTTVAGFKVFNKMPIYSGDVWMIEKEFYFNQKGTFSGRFVQFAGVKWPQMNPDKERAWDFWERNAGRPWVAYSYLPTEIEKYTQIRFGGKFLQDSLFVSINNFKDSDQFIYPAEYGRIRALVNTNNAQVESVGSILLVIGEVEAWSVYVNRRTLEDLSGGTDVSISDKVLGSFNTLLGQKGTLNPESVSVKNGRVAWWSANVGEWIRYSRDGMTEISDIGMKNWFKDLSDLIVNEYDSTAPKVLCVFDDYHKCWVTYINHSSLPETFKGYTSFKCVTFAERNDDKRWKEWFDYAPDLFASLDNEVYSIIGRTIHIHEGGEDFGSIYGVKKDSYVEVIANPEPRKNKSWVSMAIEASDKWSFESIKGDWRSNNGVRQETRMGITDLANKEWTFWTNIKKDKNTPNASSEQSGVINGENMRSKHLRIMMKLDPSVDYYSVFNYLVVKYQDSPVNPKN